MINLYGSLAKRFEKKYSISPKNINIVVTSASEMMRALEANFKGFKKLIREKGLYHISTGEDLNESKGLEENEIEMVFKSNSWHVIPVINGCGGNGVGQTIVGAVLFVVGIVFSAYGYYNIGVPLSRWGLVIALGGVAQMLASSPNTDYGSSEKQDERRSYLFSGPTNAVEPGTSIPVVYGEVYVGSITVSGGLSVENV